jgi:hypothetical protein
MSNFLNKIPVSPITSFGNSSVPNGSTFGTNFSILQTGGYMEVYTLSGLTYTIPPATTGIIEFSGNSIPIQFTKGSGSVFSPDVLTLNSDNISSGRRKLGMLVYVYETNKNYQFRIDNYDTLWNNATGATGPGGSTVVISNFGTTVKNNSPEGIAFINAWTSSTISGIDGYNDTNASWRVLSTGGSGGAFTGGTVTGATNFTGGLTATTISATTYQNLPIPTLQQVLDNNHDLVDAKNYQGTDAGFNNVGNNVNLFGTASGLRNLKNNVNAFGENSAYDNNGDNVNALGTISAQDNTGANVNALGSQSARNNNGANVNALGATSARNNTGANVNALGVFAGDSNSFNNVNLFGENAQADEDGQTVLSKDGTIMARISTTGLTDTRKYTLQDNSGTLAFTGDIPTKTSQLINDGEDGTSPYVTLDQLPSNLNLFATNASSDIATYFKLVTSISDPDYNTVAVDIPTGAITTTGQFIAALATEANVLVGNPGIINLLTIGNVRRTSGSGTAEFYYEVYHRDSGGTETLITTSDTTPPVSAGVYTEFLATALLNNGIFVETDRIVVKYYANRIGSGSNPQYDFQFGGTSPVRTTFPVPATNIPLDATPTSGSTNGVQSGGVFNALALKGNLAIQVTPITLSAASWTLVSGLYEYDYSNVNITSTSIVDVIPSNSTIAIVQTAGILPSTISTSGSVKLFANNLPTGDITVTINIFN